MATTTAQQSNKRGVVITYVIALLCLIAGLFVPLYNTESSNLLTRMLFVYLPGAINLALGQTLFSGTWVQIFNGKSISVAGQSIDILAWAILIYTVITIVAILFLVPVLGGNKDKKSYAVCAYIIEVAALIALSVYILFEMYAYNLNYTSEGKATSWLDFSTLIAFGGTLLMLIIQSIMNKKSLGVCKLFLYIFAALAALMLFDVTIWITVLKSPLQSLADTINSSVAFASVSGYQLPFVFDAFVELIGITTISKMVSGSDITTNVLTISLMALSALVVINLIIETISLSTNSARDERGHINVNAGTKIFGLVRYSLELAAAIVALVMVFVCKATAGLYLYFLLVFAVVAFIIELVRVIRIRSLKKVAEKSRKQDLSEKPAESRHQQIAISPSPIAENNLANPQVNTNNDSVNQYVYPSNETTESTKNSSVYRYENIDEQPAKKVEAPVYTESTSYSSSQTQTSDGKADQTYVYNVRAIYHGPTDKFMDTLTDAEKIEFHQVFVEKSKGTLPRIPDYVIGGNNKDFFPQIFIYLGKFRNMLSPNLLAKIYKQLNTISY